MQRVQKASAVKTAQSEANDIVMPLSTVAPMLQQNELVIASGANVAQVHTALLSFHKLLQGPRETQHTIALTMQRDKCSKCGTFDTLESCGDGFQICTMCCDVTEAFNSCANDDNAVRGCRGCGGAAELLDHHNGCMVCPECGGVLTLRSINVEPEWRSAPGVKHRASSDAKPSASKRQKFEAQSSEMHDDAFKRSTHWNELEHWNNYVRLGTDEISYLDSMLKVWKDDMCDRHSKLVAALLYHKVKPQIQTQASIRDEVCWGRIFSVNLK